jgi:hypothetical protein
VLADLLDDQRLSERLVAYKTHPWTVEDAG